MVRRRLIHLISTLLIITAVTQIWTVLLPAFDSALPKTFDPIRISLGILFFPAGWNLFRFREGGRILAFWLLFMGMAGNLVAPGFVLLPDGDFGVSIKILGNLILDSKNDYVSTVIFLSALLVIELSIIVFLSKKETKKIFLPEAIEHTAPT